METIRTELAAKRQVYFVYPVIDESEEDIQSAEVAFARIRDYFGADRVAMLHGQMKDSDKSEAFERFRTGETPILVSTSVIEVGVDVPAASVIVIQNADRFGVAQLHQLRGRVGRAANPGWCFLIADVEGDSPAAQRLRTLESTTDGFALAEADMELRGAGDLFSDRQSGGSGAQIELVRDRETVRQVREHVDSILAADADLAAPERERLKMWVRRFYTKEDVFEGG